VFWTLHGLEEERPTPTRSLLRHDTDAVTESLSRVRVEAGDRIDPFVDAAGRRLLAKVERSSPKPTFGATGSRLGTRNFVDCRCKRTPNSAQGLPSARIDHLRCFIAFELDFAPLGGVARDSAVLPRPRAHEDFAG
jgi:hypothetical protein